MKLKNIKTNQIVTKTKIKAMAILNNKIFGNDWKVIESNEKIETPPESVKVSIADTEKTTKGKK